METEINQSYIYWELLAISKILAQLKAKGYLPEGMEQFAMEDCKNRLGLSETIDELMDHSYLECIAKSYGYDMESSPLPIFQAMAKAKAKMNVDSKYQSFAEIISKSQTDMASSNALQGWLRSRNTIEVLSLWETKYNSEFQADAARKLMIEIETKNTSLTLKQWISVTGAKGIVAIQGRYGGTYAHPIIALDFEVWLSPERRFALCSRYFEKKQEIWR